MLISKWLSQCKCQQINVNSLLNVYQIFFFLKYKFVTKSSKDSQNFIAASGKRALPKSRALWLFFV